MHESISDSDYQQQEQQLGHPEAPKKNPLYKSKFSNQYQLEQQDEQGEQGESPGKAPALHRVKAAQQNDHNHQDIPNPKKPRKSLQRNSSRAKTIPSKSGHQPYSARGNFESNYVNAIVNQKEQYIQNMEKDLELSNIRPRSFKQEEEIDLNYHKTQIKITNE